MTGCVDTIGDHNLRRDPSIAHRIKHVRVIVADELMYHLTTDCERIVEPLVSFNELFDCDRDAFSGSTPRNSRSRFRSASLFTRTVPEAPAAARGLRMSG